MKMENPSYPLGRIPVLIPWHCAFRSGSRTRVPLTFHGHSIKPEKVFQPTHSEGTFSKFFHTFAAFSFAFFSVLFCSFSYFVCKQIAQFGSLCPTFLGAFLWRGYQRIIFVKRSAVGICWGSTGSH